MKITLLILGVVIGVAIIAAVGFVLLLLLILWSLGKVEEIDCAEDIVEEQSDDRE